MQSSQIKEVTIFSNEKTKLHLVTPYLCCSRELELISAVLFHLL